MPTNASSRPNAQMISVVEGNKETIRIGMFSE